MCWSWSDLFLKGSNLKAGNAHVIIFHLADLQLASRSLRKTLYVGVLFAIVDVDLRKNIIKILAKHFHVIR